MRKLIDEYQADRERLPKDLENLVTEGYMRELPIDPITGAKDWVPESGEDTVSRDGGEGIVDVHSNAQGTGSDGTAYSDY
jgi:general secretion pathway protein G